MKIGQQAPLNPVSEPDGKQAPSQNEDGSVKQVAGTKYMPEGEQPGNTGKSLKQRKVSGHPVKKLFLRIKAHLLNTHKAPEEVMDRKQLTEKLIFEWTGKRLADFSKDQVKAVESLNSFAMTAFSKLQGQGYRLSTVPIPNCVVCSKKGSKFPEQAQALISEALTKYPDLKTKIEQSEGLFKTPIMIAAESKEEVMAPEELQSIATEGSGKQNAVVYYPRVDTGESSITSAMTLFIPKKVKDREQVIEGLAKALERAVERAEEIMPEKSRAVAKQLFS